MAEGRRRTIGGALRSVRSRRGGTPRATEPWRGSAGVGAPRKPRWRRDDVMLAALGLTLGLSCALFPWYIFFNPDQFGPPAVELAGGRSGSAPMGRALADQEMSSPLALPGRETLAPPELDLFATGTAADPAAEPPAAPLDQPFPTAPPVFRLVHVENGRALLADDAGAWIVREGDELPDKSVVKSIGADGGRMVLVTSDDRVLRVEE